MTSLWERLEQTSTRHSLSAHRIATTAVAIADSDGLDAITMRRLATDLGVTPMATYRYVSGRDDVLALMVDLVHGEVTVPDNADWRDTMWALATGIRALVVEHPWLVQLSGQATFDLTPNRLALAERALAALHNLSLDADTAMSIFRTVTAYAHGATSAEIGLQQSMRDNNWSTGAETRTGLSPQMTWLLTTGRYPTFERYIHEAQRRDDPHWQFHTGLHHVLDGIAAHLAAHPTR